MRKELLPWDKYERLYHFFIWVTFSFKGVVWILAGFFCEPLSQKSWTFIYMCLKGEEIKNVEQDSHPKSNWHWLLTPEVCDKNLKIFSAQCYKCKPLELWNSRLIGIRDLYSCQDKKHFFPCFSGDLITGEEISPF